MKDFFEKNKKIILIAGIFIAVLVLYMLFFSGSSSSPREGVYDPSAGGLVSEISASPADVIIGHELLVMLSRLHSISLDSSVFSNPVFTSLKDKNKPIDPQPFGRALGRRNPFSDFGRGNSPAVVSTTTPRS